MITLNARLFLTLVAALVLTILPLPETLSVIRPAWVLLVVLYVQCCLPAYFRITWVFLLGLCLDVLCSTVMGEHAFAMLLTTWLVTHRTRRFGFFSIIQQMSIIVLFCLFYQFVIYLIDAFFGYTSNILNVLGVAFMSMLFWPWLRLLFFTRSRVEAFGVHR